MSNEESNAGQSQEQLPDLYRLLGLTPLESDIAKIQRALLEMQRRVDAAQKTDVKLSQRAAKVVAISKKNLLDADRKHAYDRAWTKAFGAAEPVAEAKPPELEWDLDELESYLPAEDPRSPFDLGGFLRYSASLPESNPSADYDKLQSFLGGTATATIAVSESISATALMAEYEQRPYADRNPVENSEPIDLSRPPSIPLRIPPGGFAQQLRRKRNRAILFSVGGIAGSIALVSGAAFIWAINNNRAVKSTGQLAQTTAPDKVKPSIPNDLDETSISKVPQGSGLPKVAGLDGSDSLPSMTAEIPTEQPAPPMPTDPSPAAPTPTSTTLPPTTPPMPTPAEPAPSPTPGPSPEPTPDPAPDPAPTPEPTVDPVLTDAEKSKWSKAMKELLKTLGNQDYATAKKQLTEAQPLARTRLQMEQLKRITTVARFAEEYHGFLVDAIASLGAAETFKIGGSSEASFIEGNEIAVALKIRGRNQTFKLTELQIGVANGLVDLKMDTAHPNSLACKAAFVLVHPKTNDLALKRAREQMAEAAGAGAVAADMATVFDEDYTLKTIP